MAKERERAGGTSGLGGLGARSSEAVTDMVRRMMAVGLSGFFTTEEALRKALGDTLPKDWIDFAAQQSERTRRDMTEVIARELGRVLDRVDLAEVLAQILEGHAVEVTARIRLMPRDDGEPARSASPTRASAARSGGDDDGERDGGG